MQIITCGYKTTSFTYNFADPVVDDLVQEWAAKVDKSMNVVKGYTRVFITRTNFYDEIFESNAGNLITDAFIDTVSTRNRIYKNNNSVIRARLSARRELLKFFVTTDIVFNLEIISFVILFLAKIEERIAKFSRAQILREKSSFTLFGMRLGSLFVSQLECVIIQSVHKSRRMV